MSRAVWYVTGTRADYGLMRETLHAIHNHEGLDLSLLVTGMHLDPAYGDTVREIESDPFQIVARVASSEAVTTGGAMARGIGRMILGFTVAMEAGRPDIVLLLGDRGEMLAAAIAAIHLDLPIAHIHGGERSGTVDEPVRHAISKLSHLHFVATAEAGERLCRMGEDRGAIFIVGAPGLVGLTQQALIGREDLATSVGLDADRPIALFVYHPVLQEADRAGDIASIIIDELLTRGFQILALKPNADSGSHLIRKVLEDRRNTPGLKVVTHLERPLFISWMAAADVMIGNSSAGIIEAGTFGTPVINVGERQQLRERNANVVDADSTGFAIRNSLDHLIQRPRPEPANIYGDGQSHLRIADLLNVVPLDGLTRKSNAY